MRLGIRLKFLVVVIFVAISITNLVPIKAIAENMKNEEFSEEEMMERMVPMMGNMMEVMVESMFRVLSKPENAQRLATFTKNYYDALIAKGFSKEEALEIITSMSIPSVPMMK